MWAVKASRRVRSGAHIRNGRIMSELFSIIFYYTPPPIAASCRCDENEFCFLHAVSSSFFFVLALSLSLPFLLSSSIRFKRLTFPIIRGHQFTFNSEQYFTGGVVGRLHDARMSLLALEELIVYVVFVAVVVKSFPRMYEENAVGECLSLNSWNRSLEEAITRFIDPRECSSWYSHVLKTAT